MDRSERRRIVYRVFSPTVMGLLAIGTVPLLLLDQAAKLGPTGILVTTVLDWAVVGCFALEYALKVSVDDSPWGYVRSPWNVVDLLIIGLPLVGLVVSLAAGSELGVLRASPLLRLLRVVRVFVLASRGVSELQLHRTLSRNHFYPIATGALAMYLVISSVFFVIETHNGHAMTYSDALWWGVGYITTIGSEVIPVTGAGRLLGGTLMAVGLGFAGVFTANVVSYIQDMRRPSAPKEGSAPSGDAADEARLRDLGERLARMEAAVERLAAALERETTSGAGRTKGGR